MELPGDPSLERRAPRWRGVFRLLATITALQLTLALLLGARGFPFFGSGRVSTAAGWELPVALLHLPGIGLLTATGYCCGLHNGLVLGPRVVAGHIRLSTPGLVILASVNWLGWLALLALGWAAWRLRPRRKGRGVPTAVGAAHSPTDSGKP